MHSGFFVASDIDEKRNNGVTEKLICETLRIKMF